MAQNERRLFGRARRANADQARQKRYSVYVQEAEAAELQARANTLGVTVPRLLFESAMNLHVETSTERKSAIAELFTVSRLLANVANNVNQIAKFANTESAFPDDAAAVVDDARALVGEIEKTIVRLANS